MTKYASTTTVSPEKTMGEIQNVLKKYGASKFGFISSDEGVMLGFEMHNRRVRFNLKFPDKKESYIKKGSYSRRSEDQAIKHHEQAIRQRWRALLLAIKAKLESVEIDIETFEEAFMAHIVLPGGQTMADWAIPQIESSYQTGKMPPLLGHTQ